MGHPEIKEAAVIAMPHERWVERPLACIVVEKGDPPGRERHESADKFAKWWLPDTVEFIEEILEPLLFKTALRERFKDYVK